MYARSARSARMPTVFGYCTIPTRFLESRARGAALRRAMGDYGECAAAWAYLEQQRRLRPSTAEHFGVKVEPGAFVFPIFSAGGEVVMEKRRQLRYKSFSYRRLTEERVELRDTLPFGLHCVPKDASEVAVTEGEFDAMSVFQETGIPAVSLSSASQTLSQTFEQCFRRFNIVYLWLDHDAAGMKAKQKLLELLGYFRCKVVQHDLFGCKDANDALQKGMDLKVILGSAQWPTHPTQITYADLHKDVESTFPKLKPK
ncbi:Twinkle protein, mitochondrial [Porphyridium purpureum]|uniref:Twinkle protein, mitochondrial n=1 Tax=Porphyridium purpureum TaxID=35688 RepID=A0A5J4YZD1_PORPP|nr:Twinkle protein, mitochondrial [Porphyridium purpureum]|eukprot:POR3111..scf208_2